MPKYDVSVSALIEGLEFDKEPDVSDIIEWCRNDPSVLLTELDVDNIEEVEE